MSCSLARLLKLAIGSLYIHHSILTRDTTTTTTTTTTRTTNVIKMSVNKNNNNNKGARITRAGSKF